MAAGEAEADVLRAHCGVGASVSAGTDQRLVHAAMGGSDGRQQRPQREVAGAWSSCPYRMMISALGACAVYLPYIPLLAYAKDSLFTMSWGEPE